MRAAVLLRRLALTGFALCLVVVVLGAYVRLTAAGLGCPDWPGCYGRATPLDIAQSATAQVTPDTGKAWREMIHRYAAGTLGLIIIAIGLIAIVTRRQRIIGVGYAAFLVAILFLQASLGMLTVTLRLTPLIVTLHLLFGMTTLALLAWLVLGTATKVAPAAPFVRRLTLPALVVLALQIALGGWTSSHYAATACPDFPTCQNAWWPPTDFKDAFVLWPGTTTSYEGGLLDAPARAAIQMTHRLGACAATLMLVLATYFTLRKPVASAARRAAWLVLTFLALQLGIAVSMVVEGFPLWLATAHNAAAACLLVATLALYKTLGPPPAAPAGSGA